MTRNDALCDFVRKTTGQGGEYWECGTFQGECAFYVKTQAITGSPRTMRLFDTFSGQPASGPYDMHPVGSMDGTSEQMVVDLFSGHSDVYIHQGVMPATFSGLEDCVISVANIDVDNHDAVKACLEFIYPRVQPGGYIALDDYGCPACPGAKKATDDFLADKPERLELISAPPVHFIKL